jgi:hypothetical protein
MANEIVTDLILDLDKFRATLKRAEDESKKSGKTVGDNLGGGAEEGLADAAKKIKGAFVAVAAGVAIAMAAIATAIKAAQIAEEAERIDHQFELLTKRSGLLGEELSRALQKSADGLIDNTDLLQAANRAMIDLGSSASKLPELLTLARQATSVFGGDLLSNFEKINLAVATGNTRMLRSVGIILDSDEAMKKFASSIGTSANALTEAGRQQAILNAVLEKGKISFQGIDGDVGKSTGSFQRLLVALKNLTEEAARAFNQVFGPAIASSLKVITGWTEALTKKIQSTFHWLSDKALRELREGVAETGKKITEEQDKRALIDILKQEENRQKLNMLANQADAEALAAKAQSAITLEQQLLLQNEREAQIRNDHLTKLQQLDLLAQQTGLVGTQAYENARAALNDSTNSRIQANNQILLQRTKQTYELFKATIVNLSSEAFSRLGAALVLGGKAFDGFGKSMLNIIGDMSIALGKAIIAQATAVQALALLLANPFTSAAASIALGAALIALGGVLKAAAGEGAAAGAEAAGGGGGAETGLAAPSGASAQLSDLERAAPATNVTVNVQGNILDRRETGLAIADVINETFGSNGIVFATGNT